MKIRAYSLKSRQSGMTLLEIIIVISLVVGLMAIIGTNITSTTDDANAKLTEIKMDKLKQALSMYKLHNGHRYPTTDVGLQALVDNVANSPKWRGPYADEDALEDAWETPFRYESDGRKFKIFSDGLDLEEGTDDDIVYPKDKSRDGDET